VRQQRNLILVLVLCALGVGTLCLSKEAYISPEARLVAIRRAQVWKPTKVAEMDMQAGPQGKGAVPPGTEITCEFREKKVKGRSPKFACVIGADDEVKVKYGRDNGEVYGEVAATRLLWALGFLADRMYPVRVVCLNCPPNPVIDTKNLQESVTFNPAAIEREVDGESLETKDGSGWPWTDLDKVEVTAGGAPVAQRDALKLLAAMIQHTDNKAEQQRLLCAPGEKIGERGEPCVHTFMMISDLGLTFGHANLFNRNPVGSVNFEQWTRAPIWSNPDRCVAELSQSQTGTLNNPVISEAGRKFLEDLLVQLSDKQLHDLFEVARFAERTGPGIRAATVNEWVGAFNKKRAEIVNQTCPT
jgi:hypothetical protein